jgi:predicted RNase H-like nuclease (RuvC/YqgF family)
VTATEIIALVSTSFVAIFGYFKWWVEIREKDHERKEKEAERAQKEKVMKELAEIHRRADAPFLQLCNSRFNMLYHEADDGKLVAISCMEAGMLSAFQMKVSPKIEDGDEVVLLNENSGQPAHAVRLTLDGLPVRIYQEADMQHSGNHQYIIYPYRKAKHGSVQRIQISFESKNGVQDTHSYETHHGVRTLRRIDPPLP